MTLLFVIKTIEFEEWFEDQSHKDRIIILSRIARIEAYAHFGDSKDIGDDVFELRWKNGRRVYFALIEKQRILFLLGGLKNAQKKDIKKAKHILKRYEAD